jgi:hypothetical protein
MKLIKEDALTWTEKTHSTHALKDFFVKREAHLGYIIKPHWDVSIDHILPDSLGGIDHPRNYMFVSTALNASWSNGCLEHKFQILGRNTRTFINFLKAAKRNMKPTMNAYLKDLPPLQGATLLKD